MSEVLIVDDDIEAQEPLARFLEKAGYAVRRARNGRAALAAILDRTPDVVVLDLLMPEMDGPSLLEVVRSYLRLQSLPVVVLTALEEGPLIDRARNAKVNAILRKSKASLEEVKSAIEHATCQIPG
jgi:CheY-like chemotaxis protein